MVTWFGCAGLCCQALAVATPLVLARRVEPLGQTADGAPGSPEFFVWRAEHAEDGGVVLLQSLFGLLVAPAQHCAAMRLGRIALSIGAGRRALTSRHAKSRFRCVRVPAARPSLGPFFCGAALAPPLDGRRPARCACRPG